MAKKTLMSDAWWQPGDLSSRSGAGRSTTTIFHDPSATPLHLPPLLWAGTTHGEIASYPSARSLDCRHAGLTIGTAKAQRGFVKQWKARSVDLRHLLFQSLRLFAAPLRQGTLNEDDSVAAAAFAGAALTAMAGQATAHGRPPSPQEMLARRLGAVLQPPPETLLRADGPLEWPGTFFPYQRDGIRALLHSPHLLLGDDLGLGKTIQAIAALRLLLHGREIERALIVVPASLLEQWRAELAHWSPELRVMLVYGVVEDRLWQWQYRAHVTLTSYETLRADCTTSPHCGPRREVWGVVVLDEAQKIKNRDTDVARACRRLPRHRSWALTGTPLENRARDVASILEFVLGDDTPSSPVLTFEPSLRALLGQCQLRRRKADVLQELPPKITTELVLPLTPAQRRAYERVAREGLAELRTASHNATGEAPLAQVLDQITQLKQICNFAPNTENTGAGHGGTSAKLDDLIGRLEELTAEGHKALVFTQYTSAMSGARRIAHGLRRFAPLLYTGDMSLRERSAVVQQFRDEEKHSVLILSVQAGGQGLNLQCASYVFHFDRWWNPAIEMQAEGRAHRLGQTQPVHVYKYIMADTIEERIAEALKGKVRLFEEWVDTSSFDLSRLLDKRGLYELVGLEIPSEVYNTQHQSQPGETLGDALEKRVAALLARQGYAMERTGGSRDGGVDVIAAKTDAVGTRTRLFVQCKDTARPVSVEVVRSLNGMLPPGDRGVQGVVVCPAGFTPEAKTFAFARHIQLWDAAKLDDLEQGAK